MDFYLTIFYILLIIAWFTQRMDNQVSGSGILIIELNRGRH